MISNSKLLLASTALVAFAGVANAADTAVVTSGAVAGVDATQLTLANDGDTSGTVTTGDTVATDADIAAELAAGNTGTVITADVAGVILDIDHDVTTTGATAIDLGVAAPTTTVAAGVTVTGATNAILVSADVATGTTVDGTLSGAFDASAAATAATGLTVSSTGTVGAVTVGDGDATIAVEGTAGAISTGAGTNSVTVENGGEVASITGGAGVDTLVTSAGVGTVTGNISAVENVDVTGDFVLGGTTAPATGLLVTGTLGTTELTTTAAATVNSGSSLSLNGTSTVGSDLTVAGDLTVAAGSTTVASNTDVTGSVLVKADEAGTGATFDAGTLVDVDTKLSNITLELGSDATKSGKLVATSNTIDLDDAVVGLTVARGTTIADNTDFASLIDAGTASAIDATELTSGNAIYDYTWTVNGTDFDLNVTQKNAGVTTLEDAVSAGFSAMAAQIENAGAGASSNTEDLFADVFAQEDTELAMESIASDVSGGLVQAGFDAANGSSKAVSTRLAALRGQSGVAAGDMAANGNMWVKAYGTSANQDAKVGTAGYDADTFGVAYGIDSDRVVDGATVGLAVSYADSEVDTVAGSVTDISSYQLTGYMSKDMGHRAYMDTQLGFAYNDYEGTRTDFLGDTYASDYEGWQATASVEGGRSYDMAGATVTPNAGLQYIYQSMDNYTETGAGVNGLTVDNDDVNALYARFGADVAWDLSTESGTQYRPYLTAGLSYDLIGDEMEARTAFQAGGNAFVVKGAEVEKTALELGAGVEIFSANGMDLTVAYDGLFKDDYDAHTGSVKARWAF